MLIRTQNKKGIVNINRIDTIDVYDKQVRYFSGGGIDSMGLLGTYSTEEKAIKVLDMIQQEYGKHLYGQGGQMATVDIYIQPFAFVPPKVFQMPSDEEVRVQHERIYRKADC